MSNFKKKLSDSPGDPVFSDEFWFKGYEMRLQLSFSEDANKCSFYLSILNLKGEACVNVSYKAESILFASRVVRTAKRWYKEKQLSWGFRSKERNLYQMEDGITIDVWVNMD